MSAQPPVSRAEEFTPQSVLALRRGYGLGDLRADALAGLTVAIVALPLSMAIAIASGLGPERGLYTAIIGGFLVSLLGGSRFQVGGPAGAFIVLVSAAVMQIGLTGLILATFISGFFLIAIGVLRLGNYIKFIPFPVTVGFTAGIAVIIIASQLRDFLGLRFDSPEPAEILPKLVALWDARATFDMATALLALATVLVILGLRKYRPGWPGMLIAVVLGGLLRHLACRLKRSASALANCRVSCLRLNCRRSMHSWLWRRFPLPLLLPCLGRLSRCSRRLWQMA